jgi:RNA polymerase subunit RPABC4/transcription elongation factor Spt4
MHDTCPRCGSDKLIPQVPLLDHYGDTGTWSDQAEVQVHGTPQAWVFKDTVAGKLSVRICGACGHAELQVSNFHELYEKYKASGQLGATAPLEREEACLSCGKPIPSNATECPSCGWTWEAKEQTSA